MSHIIYLNNACRESARLWRYRRDVARAAAKSGDSNRALRLACGAQEAFFSLLAAASMADFPMPSAASSAIDKNQAARLSRGWLSFNGEVA